MYLARDDARLRAPGCPIRKSPDQSLLGGSPKLIAAYHVLHRWLAPRHSPCALSSLTIQRVSHTQDCTLTEDTYYSVVKDQIRISFPHPRLNEPESLFARSVFPIPRSGGWWSGPGLNRQPSACKADALPIELPPRFRSHRTKVPTDPPARNGWA
jgi:hypothetical protein